MSEQITITGHAWNRIFSVTDGSKYKETRKSGGAALLASLLKLPYEMPRRPKAERILGGTSAWTDGGDRLPLAPAERTVVWDQGEGFGALAAPESGQVLWISGRSLPGREIVGAMQGRCLLLLDADALRRNGAMVSKQVSWERSAAELLEQLRFNPAVNYLMQARRLLVLFGEDGALLLRDGEATLCLAHGREEGTLRKGKALVQDAWAHMAAETARQWQAEIFDLAAVLKAAQAQPAEPKCYPVPAEIPGDWCLIESERGTLYKRAFDLAKNGYDAIEGFPQLTFGDLTTVDRKEIEAYQNIKNLILEYASGRETKPISIAVFGQPGSGKSFGVTEIAENLLPNIKQLEFNVSQFVDEGDIAAAFHQVRDLILGGMLPLVFFDEFDAQDLKWVKNFLMPMQEGTFKDGSGVHPVGKCILVFAGGTSHSFKDFRGRADDGFRKAKGPDFVSRLRGSIDILGPNRLGDGDNTFLLRRALLLRSLCERRLGFKSGEAPVNEVILRAMLLTPKYEHGARSMKAVLDMSRIPRGARFEPAMLPAGAQLELHVDAEAFSRQVRRESVLNQCIEALAQNLHAVYLAAREEERGKNPAEKKRPNEIPWDELTEEFKDSNRGQARDMTCKLKAEGYDYDAAQTPFPAIQDCAQEELDRMAEAEHIRWMKEKTEQGWTYGEPRDNANKKHPLMKPYAQLSEADKDLDRKPVREMISMLDAVGIGVYRRV